MTGAFFTLLILLYVAGITIILEIIRKIINFCFVLIRVIIAELNSKNKKENQTIKKYYETSNINITTNSTKNRKQLLTEYEKDIIEKYTGKRPEPYYLEESEKWQDSYFKFEKEKFFCERCFRRISEEEYNENDGMCEDCYEDIANGENF